MKLWRKAPWEGVSFGLTTGEWSRSVRERAGHRCELCGRFVQRKPESTDEDPCGAHHILPRAYWRTFRKEPANGICLCGKCHYGIHNGQARVLGQKALAKIHWEDLRALRRFRRAVGNALKTGSYYRVLEEKH